MKFTMNDSVNEKLYLHVMPQSDPSHMESYETNITFKKKNISSTTSSTIDINNMYNFAKPRFIL